jgi:hypothetical protein
MGNPMAPPVFLSVRTLGELLRSRQVSPVELTTIFLDRLEARGPTYNAVVTLPRDLALGQVRAAGWVIGSRPCRTRIRASTPGIRRAVLAVCPASLVHAEYGSVFGAHENMLAMPAPHPSPARHHGPKSHPARR